MSSPATRAVDAALVDFGGVVVPSPFPAFEVVERSAGLPSGFVRAVNARNRDANAWARLERGEIDVDRFCRDFAAEAAEAGGSIDAAAVIAPLLGGTVERARAYAPMLDAIAECRARGVRVVLVTNDVAPMSADPAADWVFEIVDAVVESCVVGARKPDPAFYRIALEQAGAEPERTVMLDDLGVNLKPARALGMQTVKVADPAVAAAELRGLLDRSG